MNQLNRAFDRLEEEHAIACRFDYWCCQTCGIAAMQEENKGDWKGYCFCHQQDVDGLARSNNLRLAYGLLGTGPDASDGVADATEVGRLVKQELEKQGLTVIWDGSPGTRIKVVNLLDLDKWQGLAEERREIT